MKRLRTLFVVTLALGICAGTGTADAQQGGTGPQHIRTTQSFLLAWGNQRWGELRSVAADQVVVKVGTDVFTLEPASQRSDVVLVLPFRGMSTVRADGRVTAIAVDEMVFKVGDRETRGPAMINLKEENGEFKITGVSSGGAQQAGGARY